MEVDGEGVEPDQGEDVQPHSDWVGGQEKAGRGQGEIMMARIIEVGQLKMEEGQIWREMQPGHITPDKFRWH